VAFEDLLLEAWIELVEFARNAGRAKVARSQGERLAPAAQIGEITQEARDRPGPRTTWAMIDLR
jgi:hypothetical protein